MEIGKVERANNIVNWFSFISLSRKMGDGEGEGKWMETFGRRQKNWRYHR